MTDTYRALLIKDGTIEPVDLRKAGDGASHVHELIGDTFCQCFAVPIDGRRVLVAYCDDTFLRKDLPLNVILSENVYQWERPGYPIHGPIVVTAVVAPDTVSMTDAERSRFFIEDHAAGPLLRYNWGPPTGARLVSRRRPLTE